MTLSNDVALYIPGFGVSLRAPGMSFQQFWRIC